MSSSKKKHYAKTVWLSAGILVLSFFVLSCKKIYDKLLDDGVVYGKVNCDELEGNWKLDIWQETEDATKYHSCTGSMKRIEDPKRPVNRQVIPISCYAYMLYYEQDSLRLYVYDYGQGYHDVYDFRYIISLDKISRDGEIYSDDEFSFSFENGECTECTTRIAAYR